MKILYIANARMPTEKAHGLQIMKTCEAFADLGHTVTLFVPRRHNHISGDPFAYYGVRKNFALCTIYSLDLIPWGGWGFWVQHATFSMAAAFAVRKQQADLIYGREEFTLATVSLVARAPIMWETHVGAWSVAVRLLARRARSIVSISQGLKDFYISKGIAADRIIVAPDGVDLADFAHPQPKADARARLGLPLDAKIALYIGRLDSWKGADTLATDAALLAPDIRVAFIGGETEQVEAMRAKYPEAMFLGYRPYRELADNQVAADVLVIPNTARDEISARFTSPLKLFTYMASGIPIVASDLPSIREVLHERSAFFATPDDPQSFADAIKRAIDAPDAAARADAARTEVERYAWKERAAIIIGKAGHAA